MRPRLGRRSLTSPEIQPPAKSLDASGGDVFSEKLTPTRNAIGLSSQVSRVADDGVGELSPWRSVLPPSRGRRRRQLARLRWRNMWLRASSSISVLKVNLSFSATALAAAGRALISSTRRLTLGSFDHASSPRM